MGYFDDKEDNLGRVSQCLMEIRKAMHGISFPFPGILQLWCFASFPDERLFSGRWRYWEQVVRKGERALLIFIWVHVSFQDVSEWRLGESTGEDSPIIPLQICI